jgi:DNA-binding MarR family transcriptional regulator
METNEKLFTSIFNVSRILRRKILVDECFKDLSHSEVEALLFLKEAKIATMKAIADHLEIKPSSITPVIDKLFHKKLLHRVADKKDRRIIYISLTKNGSKGIENKRKQLHKNIKKMFSELSEKDKKNLTRIFQKITKNYE